MLSYMRIAYVAIYACILYTLLYIVYPGVDVKLGL